VIHTISLADDLRVEGADELMVRTEGLDIEPEGNLVWRAARLFSSATRERRGAALTLVKRIPAAAGLGGGSSDAATTLVGLNRLWGARSGLGQLCSLAAELGSDVPFFVRGGAALMTGTGEQLQPLPPIVGQWLVVVVPGHDLANKTRRLYAALTPDEFTSGERTRGLAQRVRNREPLRATDFANVFTRAAREIFPGLAEGWATIERIAQRRFFLSGAGPALFSPASDRRDANRQAALLANAGVTAHVVRSVKRARASIAIAGP
jgi:4-diphosphocytidyl-2-C-methyl-D-erythritol kinase